MFCKNCGKQLEDGSAFCNACGAPSEQAPAPIVAPDLQPLPAPTKKHFSGYTIFADILAFLQPFIVGYVAYCTQQSYTQLTYRRTVEHYIPVFARLILLGLVLVLTAIGFICSFVSKQVQMRNKIGSAILTGIMSVISILVVFLF